MPAITASPLVPASGVPRRQAWTALALGLALLLMPRIAAADDKANTANTANKTGNKTGGQTGGSSVADGFRSLGQQLSDPKTLDRIKGHEQEFEKNVQGTRDQQRKSHPGELRASDATDMATDPKLGGRGKASGGASSGTKSTSTTSTTTTTSKGTAAAKPAPPNSAAAVPHDSSGAPPAAKAPPKAPPPAATPAR